MGDYLLGPIPRGKTPKVNLTKDEMHADLSAERIPAVEKKRRCRECGKILSCYNRHPDKCFIHSRTPRERDAWEKASDKPVHSVCSSRSAVGFNRAQIEYHGSPKGL
jgi:hypothetical protein